MIDELIDIVCGISSSMRSIFRDFPQRSSIFFASHVLFQYYLTFGKSPRRKIKPCGLGRLDPLLGERGLQVLCLMLCCLCLFSIIIVVIIIVMIMISSSSSRSSSSSSSSDSITTTSTVVSSICLLTMLCYQCRYLLNRVLTY